MKTIEMRSAVRLTIVLVVLLGRQYASAFEGRISLELIQGSETNTLLYTVGANDVRIENLNTNWPHPVNLVDLQSGNVTLIFPHNRTLVRMKQPGSQGTPAGAHAELSLGKFPQPGLMPGTSSPPNSPLPPGGLPPGIGPQAGAGPGTPTIPVMPMPMMPMAGRGIELKATGETKPILGVQCTQYEIKVRGEAIEIWATISCCRSRRGCVINPGRSALADSNNAWRNC